jgi:hypothetical protein
MQKLDGEIPNLNSHNTGKNGNFYIGSQYLQLLPLYGERAATGS